MLFCEQFIGKSHDSAIPDREILGHQLICYLAEFMYHKEKDLFYYFLWLLKIFRNVWGQEVMSVIIRLYHCFQYTARVVAQVIEISVASYTQNSFRLVKLSHLFLSLLS